MGVVLGLSPLPMGTQDFIFNTELQYFENSVNTETQFV